MDEAGQSAAVADDSGAVRLLDLKTWCLARTQNGCREFTALSDLLVQQVGNEKWNEPLCGAVFLCFFPCVGGFRNPDLEHALGRGGVRRFVRKQRSL